MAASESAAPAFGQVVKEVAEFVADRPSHRASARCGGPVPRRGDSGVPTSRSWLLDRSDPSGSHRAVTAEASASDSATDLVQSLALLARDFL